MSNIVVIAANSSWNLFNFRLSLMKRLQQAGYRVIGLAPRDSFTASIEAEGFEVVPIAIDSAGLSPVGDAALLMRYVGHLRRLRPAAFLGFTVKPNIYGSIAARLLGIPTINNISGLGTAFIRESWLTAVVRRLYRLALSRAARVFFQNPDDRDLFVSQGIVSDRQAQLIPGSGVDLDRFQPTDLPAASDAPTFLLIARLLWDKGVGEFVEAARLVRERLPAARFQLLGAVGVANRTAVPRADLDRWVALGLIDYLGEQEDVRPFIAAADCVVLPSYREGLPKVLLEAAAMARPLIGSNVPGVREVVEDGVTGLRCAVRDASSLAQAMLAFAELTTSARRAMGQAGRRMVETKYCHTVVAQHYLDALSAVVAKR